MRRIVALVCALAMCSIGVGLGDASTMKRPAGHSVRYLTAVKLARGIAAFCSTGAGACALRGQAFTIEDVGHQTHLSPAFMVAASMTESSGGDAACGGNPMNIWGLSSCGSGWYVPHFQSWRQAFTFFARFIHTRWPSARTAFDLPGYSACDACWGPRTALFMGRLGFGAGLAYS